MTDRREADRRNVNAIDLVLVFGLSLVLVALGALMVAAAIWLTTDRDAVSSTLTIMGAGLILIGVVLPRLSGPQSFVPSGVRGPLGELLPLVAEKTLQKAKEQDLPPDRTAAATAIAASTAAASLPESATSLAWENSGPGPRNRMLSSRQYADFHYANRFDDLDALADEIASTAVDQSPAVAETTKE